MILTGYRPADCRELAELFYDTVHTINAGDYTEEQLTAWADGTGREALRQLRIFHCGACDGRATERILRTIGLEGKG